MAATSPTRFQEKPSMSVEQTPLSEAQVRQFHEEGYLFLPEAFRAEEVAVLREEALGIYRADRQEIWREKSGAPRTVFAAHTYNEAFRLLAAHPKPDPSGGAAVRRAAVHAPVQDQREIVVQRRGLAVAPGLRHLGARRRDARTARDEHLRLSRRGHAHQRPADDRAAQPSRRHAGGRARRHHDILSAMDSGRRDGDASWWTKAGSWSRSASPAAC